MTRRTIYHIVETVYDRDGTQVDSSDIAEYLTLDAANKRIAWLVANCGHEGSDGSRSEWHVDAEEV